MSLPSPATDLTRYPVGRYGRRRDPARYRSRWPLFALGLVMVDGSIAIARTLYDKCGPQDYEATVIRWTEVADAQIVITFRVGKPTG